MTDGDRRSRLDGIRAARAFLSLLEEFSSDELRSAEQLLGGDRDLALALQHMRRFVEKDTSTTEPFTVESLRRATQKFVAAQGVPLELIRDLMRGAAPLHNEINVRLSVATTLDEYFNLLQETPPRSQVDAIVQVLEIVVRVMGLSAESNLFLRSCAERALAENEIIFPSLHSLAQLRAQWSKEPLGFSSKDTRTSVIRRLLDDVDKSADPVEHLIRLIRDGLRGPADTASVRIYERTKRNKPADR